MKVKEFFQSMIYFTSGCTEPAAIGLNAARARASGQTGQIKQIILQMDYLTYKNAFNAGIPNAPLYKGAMWAFLLGYAVGDPSLGLEIFSRLNDESIRQAEEMERTVPFHIRFVERGSLYLKSMLAAKEKIICTTTRECHSAVTQEILSLSGFAVKDLDHIILELDKREHRAYSEELRKAEVFDDSYYEPSGWVALVDEIYSDGEIRSRIQEGINANISAQNAGRREWDTTLSDYGTGSAIFARMSGKPIKVMACANSGNKGLTSVVPTVNYCRKKKKSKEETLKAVIMACFVNSIITLKFGFISSVCGVVYGAGAGFLSAIMMLDGQLDSFDKVFINYISSFGGIFCDGAKVSCAVKGNTAVQAAITAKKMYEKGLIVDYHDGYLGRTFLETLDNLMKYNEAMREMDKITVSILENKK